jgi:SAM-dependent methyltransferase
MDIQQLIQTQQKPAPFTPGEPLFWDDPHISQQMLKAHLNPNTHASSYPPDVIEQSIAWIIETVPLAAGATILDLGCGPGLYASRLAKQGFQVSGMDYSRSSIAYAKAYAEEHQLDIQYRYQNYLTLEDANLYDAVLLISGDFCPLSPDSRKLFLQNIHRALKDGGHFVLDVTTPNHLPVQFEGTRWQVRDGGFWKPTPHLVLEQGIKYPEENAHLTQFNVLEEDGTLSVYRNWLQLFTKASITQELEAGGFNVIGVWNDLRGTPYTEGSDWLGLIAQKCRDV